MSYSTRHTQTSQSSHHRSSRSSSGTEDFEELLDLGWTEEIRGETTYLRPPRRNSYCTHCASILDCIFRPSRLLYPYRDRTTQRGPPGWNVGDCLGCDRDILYCGTTRRRSSRGDYVEGGENFVELGDTVEPGDTVEEEQEEVEKEQAEEEEELEEVEEPWGGHDHFNDEDRVGFEDRQPLTPLVWNRPVSPIEEGRNRLFRSPRSDIRSPIIARDTFSPSLIAVADNFLHFEPTPLRPSGSAIPESPTSPLASKTRSPTIMTGPSYSKHDKAAISTLTALSDMPHFSQDARKTFTLAKLAIEERTALQLEVARLKAANEEHVAARETLEGRIVTLKKELKDVGTQHSNRWAELETLLQKQKEEEAEMNRKRQRSPEAAQDSDM